MFLPSNTCPKGFCILCIRCYNLFSLITSIYLLIKPVLLELTHFVLVSIDLSSFYFSSLQYLLLYFCFHFSFKFYLFCRLFCLPLLQIIFLLSSKAFSLPRSVLSSFNLTLQSSFPPRLFLLTFCFFFFSSILVTKATST